MNDLRTEQDLEERRLRKLRALKILDTPPEPLIDSLTRLAADICGTPIALVSLVDEGRQWFKSSVGLPGVEQTPREVAFCSHTILQPALFEVNDAAADERFSRNPLVTGDPYIRFYAGMPLEVAAGVRLGSLCVIDRQPRLLDEHQRRRLSELARAVTHALLLRDPGALSLAEQALADSEQRFREICEASPFGVFRTDQEGRCTYTNGHWQALFGLDPVQSLGDGWRQGVHELDRDAVSQRWQAAARSGAAFDMEFTVRQASGTLRRVRSRARPLPGHDADSAGFVGAVEDISERHHMLQRLRESEELLDRAGRLAGVGGWSLDLGSGQLYWSGQTCRLHGLEPGYQPTVEQAFLAYTEDARPQVQRAVDDAIVSGKPYDLELQMRTVRGDLRWVRSVGEVAFDGPRAVRLFGAIQDITARRRMESHLVEANDQLRQLYEQTPALLLSIDGEGRVLSASDLLLARTGYERADVVGRPLDGLLGGGARLQRVVAELHATGRCECTPFRLACRDGGHREVFLSAIVESGRAGRWRALAAFEDVTETVNRTRELQHEHSLRLQVERHADELVSLLAERSEMLDVLAHEVRQPLNNASAALQSAQKVLGDLGEHAAYEQLCQAQSVIGQMVVNVDNTLAVASLLVGRSEIEFADTDLDMLIGIAVADMSPEDRRRVQVVRETTVRTLWADASLLRLALRNLLANALAFAPAGRPVQLRLSDGESPVALQIDVIDDGPGVAPELRERLFQRGVRGPQTLARPSHGLGLYIVRQAMELQGGQALLWQSGPAGTTMRLLLHETGPDSSRPPSNR